DPSTKPPCTKTTFPTAEPAFMTISLPRIGPALPQRTALTGRSIATAPADCGFGDLSTFNRGLQRRPRHHPCSAPGRSFPGRVQLAAACRGAVHATWLPD